ncbi:phage antirepressor KilAC domain-containing protein [Robinsoniella peoriensis]|uniref:phage antirepressor KilAC domain-containing protein n=1 Tax=Robinsoniella peoriensis TaxID=180332 RepID=UPI00085CC716|nr:phage antirepressor KilAC domain-containing protein [Robinsoniella peoriensis]
MNNLIKINYDTERPTVSARDLHEGLGIGTQYTKWFERMSEYGFCENADYTATSQKRLTAQGNETTFTDHNISVDMAKQICMIQRTEKGREYRQYFLDLEKAWNTPEQIFARALKMADQEINKLKSHNTVLLEDVQRMKPKEIFADAVSASHTSILIGDLAKLLKQNGYATGQKRLFEQLRHEGYLIKGGSSKNMPSQKSMEMELFEVKETSISNPDGSIRVTKTTKVTGKGQQYFINHYLAPDIQQAS